MNLHEGRQLWFGKIIPMCSEGNRCIVPLMCRYCLLLALCALALGSCTFDGTSANGTSAIQSDASDNGRPDGAEVDAQLSVDSGQPDAALYCFGDDFPFPVLNISRCDPEEAMGAVNLDGFQVTYRWNTETGIISNNADSSTITVPYKIIPNPSGPDLFVASVTNFSLGLNSTLRPVGQNAFVLLSSSDITISGLFLANGGRNSNGPGGNNDISCATGRGQDGVIQTDTAKNTGGSGGGGAGFLNTGGTGATIANVANEGAASLGGSPQTLTLTLRGGCAGGSGGGDNSGAGGGAGGAVQLVAANHILLNPGARITVSGGGGNGGEGVHSGGGGGGSGGGLLLQSSTRSNLGFITTNGGAGGEGVRGGGTGDSGLNGYRNSDTPSAGGRGFTNGGNGGNGGTVNVLPNDGTIGSFNMFNASGGGGGGGAAGAIRLELNP